MLKTLVLALGMSLALAIGGQAAEKGGKQKKGGTPEQQAVVKQMLEKYDTNKDGKLDKNERKAMSQEDKQKLKDATSKAEKEKKEKKEKEQAK